MREALFALTMFLICAEPLNAVGQQIDPELFSSFDYCAPPVRPSCVDQDGTFKDAKKIAACNDAMSHYVSSVFVYRTCMYSKIEKTIRETNAAVALLKCREAHQTACAD